MANVAGAFRAAQPQQVEGKRILLVDDVITTGTTAAACAQALLHAGADSVFALAFATVEFGAPPDDTTPICEDDEEDVYSDFEITLFRASLRRAKAGKAKCKTA